MADIRTRPSGLFKWTCGIAALVVGSFLIFHLLRPKPATGVAPTELDGFVADATSHQLLRNSLVTVSLGDYSAQQRTDTFGRYAVVFPSQNAEASVATVRIETAGYRTAANEVPLYPGSNYAEILLSAHPHAGLGQNSSQAQQDGAPGLIPVVASTSPPQVGRAEIVLKSLPSDFMKASRTYAVAANK